LNLFDIFDSYSRSLPEECTCTGLPRFYFNESQHQLFNSLNLRYFSVFGFEYHSWDSPDSFDILFQCTHAGVGQYVSIASSLELHTLGYNTEFVASLSYLRVFLYSLHTYRNSKDFTYWIEADFVHYKHASIFVSTFDRKVLLSDIPKLIGALEQSKHQDFVLKVKALMYPLSMTLHSVAKCGGLVSEFGFINRLNEKTHFKLLCSQTLDNKSHHIESDLSFFYMLVKEFLGIYGVEIKTLPLELVTKILDNLQPERLFISVSIFPRAIILDLELYPPLDSNYIDNGTGVGLGFVRFWEHAFSLLQIPQHSGSSYSHFSVNNNSRILIKDKLHHLKLTGINFNGEPLMKFYRKTRVVPF